MKIFKLSSILCLSLLFMWIAIPHASAKEHKRYKIRSTSFGLSLNINPWPRYVGVVERPAPAYIERTTVIHHYAPAPYYREPYYREAYSTPYYREERIVERAPAYVERVYAHPHYGYWVY